MSFGAPLLPAFLWGAATAAGPTFGLIGVDRATQGRTVHPTARWLGEFARSHPKGP